MIVRPTPDDRILAAVYRRMPFQPAVWWLYGADHVPAVGEEIELPTDRHPALLRAGDLVDRLALWLNAHHLTRRLDDAAREPAGCWPTPEPTQPRQMWLEH